MLLMMTAGTARDWLMMMGRWWLLHQEMLWSHSAQLHPPATTSSPAVTSPSPEPAQSSLVPDSASLSLAAGDRSRDCACCHSYHPSVGHQSSWTPSHLDNHQCHNHLHFVMSPNIVIIVLDYNPYKHEARDHHVMFVIIITCMMWSLIQSVLMDLT